ncbi:MAG TPA: hypothetical protein VGI39_39705 [Polyangiaceae bacterium]
MAASLLAASCSASWVPSWLRDPAGPSLCQPQDGWECRGGVLEPISVGAAKRPALDGGTD